MKKLNTIYINVPDTPLHNSGENDDDDAPVILRKEHLLKQLMDHGFKENLTGIVALDVHDVGTLASESVAYVEMDVGEPLLNCKFFMTNYKNKGFEKEEEKEEEEDGEDILKGIKEERQGKREHARGEAVAFVRRNYMMLYGILHEMEFDPENYARDELRLDGAVFTRAEAISLFRSVHSMLARTSRVMNHCRAVQSLDPVNRFKQVHRDNTSPDALFGIVFEDTCELGPDFGDRVRETLEKKQEEDWSVLLFDCDGDEKNGDDDFDEHASLVAVYNLDPKSMVVRKVKKQFMKHLSLKQCREQGHMESLNAILFQNIEIE